MQFGLCILVIISIKKTEDDKIEGMSQYASSGVVFEVIK